MLKILFVLSALCSRGVLSQGENCPEGQQSELPKLPKYFSATVQYNIKSDSKFKTRCDDCEKLPDGIVAAPPSPGGKSVSVDLAFDDTKKAGYVMAYQEMNFGSDTAAPPVFITEKVIYNDELTGFDGFLTHVMSDTGIEYCVADSLIEDGGLASIFGVYCPDKNPKDCVKPTVSGMLFGEFCWQKGKKTVIRGVDVIEYNATLFQNDDIGFMRMKYYWSDLDTWVSTSGKGTPVPIAAIIEGEVKESADAPITRVEIEMDYQNFFVMRAPTKEFNAPRFQYCRGRTLDQEIPHHFPQHYTFGSELVFIDQIHDEPAHKIISGRKEWYDYDFNISRIDYKPYNHGNPLDPFAGDENNVMEILDFNVGMKFVIDQVLGNCSISKITIDPFGPDGDIVIDDQGHIQMVSPIQHFRMDRKFQYNGEIYDRGMIMNEFATSILVHEGEEGKEINMTTLVYTASSKYINVDQESELYIPTKIITYPSDGEHMDWNLVQTYNIYHFTSAESNVQHFDISMCYKLDEKMRLSISFPMVDDLDLDAAQTLLFNVARLMVAGVGNVAYLRVQDVQMLVFEAEGRFDILFTVVAPPPLPEGPDAEKIPQGYLTTNDVVKANIQTWVDAGNFTLFSEGTDGVAFAAIAIGGSLMEVDASGAGPGSLAGSSVNYDQGYTSGAMAGLAFGMIFLGIFVATGLYFVFFRNNVRAGLPAIRGFDNPLAGLSNLGK